MGARPKAERTADDRPYRIDMQLPEIGRMVGLPSDRVRLSTGTRDLAVRNAIRDMLLELHRRREWRALRMLLVHEITLLDAVAAVAPGGVGIDALCQAAAERHVERDCAAGEAAAPRREDTLLTHVIGEHLGQPTRTGVAREDGGTKKQRAMLNRFVEYAGGEEHAKAKHLGDVDLINGWLNSLTNLRTGEPLNGATRQRYRAALSGLCRTAVDREYLTANPVAKRDGRTRVVRFKENKHRMPDFFFDEHLYTRYFDAIAEYDGELVPFFRLLAHTGMDLHELLELDGAGVEMGAGKITWITTTRLKTDAHNNAERKIPVPAKHINADLTRHFKRVPRLANARVFRDLDRKFGTSGVRCDRVRRAHEYAAAKLGHGNATHAGRPVDSRSVLRLKDLRHVAAIIWAKAGVSLAEIQRRLGHTNIEQTMKYARYTLTGPEDAASARAVSAVVDRLCR